MKAVNALRSLLFLALLLIFTPPYTLSVILLCFWMPHRWRRRAVTPWVNFTCFLIKHVLGIKYRIIGQENIPSEPCVILCKHQSAWETVVLQQVFKDVLFVWRKEIKYLPFFGWALALTPMISVDRKGGKEALRQLLEQGKMRLDQGYPVIIFPEGTRAPPGGQQSYKIGGAFLACKSAVPVLPVAHNAGEYWGRNALFKTPGTVTVSIGPLIATNGLKADAVNTQAEAWIETEMRNISPHMYSSHLHESTQPTTPATP